MKEKTIGKYILIVGIILILIRAQEIIDNKMDIYDYTGVILGFIHVIFGIYLLKRKKQLSK